MEIFGFRLKIFIRFKFLWLDVSRDFLQNKKYFLFI